MKANNRNQFHNYKRQ